MSANRPRRPPIEFKKSGPAEPPSAPSRRPHPLAAADDLSGQTVYVVDSHSLIFQVFHVLTEMSGPAGQPVGAVYGFTRDILDLLEKKRPDYLFCAFDSPGHTFRHGLYADYKINRAGDAGGLRPQIPAIRRVLEAMGIPVLQLAGFEADDILATVARQAERLGAEVYLVTSDKDCRQLITDRVRLSTFARTRCSMPKGCSRIGASGPTRPSIFRRWSATRWTTCRASR